MATSEANLKKMELTRTSYVLAQRTLLKALGFLLDIF